MPILFPKHLCASAVFSVPRHSWRSDRHGECVGQQPWNKYGRSWVRRARIICFAICLCASVYVMTIVLPGPVSPRLLGRRLTGTLTDWMHAWTRSVTCARTHRNRRCFGNKQRFYLTKSVVLLNGTVHSGACTQSLVDKSPAVAPPRGSGTALPLLWASGLPLPLELTGWQLPGRIGVGDCSAGSALPCDSLQ